MFLLKKIISPMLTPLSASLLLALVGLFCLWFTRKQKTGKVLLTSSTVFLGLLGYGVVSDMLARPLEEKYPPLRSLENIQDVKWIVVLGGGREGTEVRSQESERGRGKRIEDRGKSL